MIAKTSGIRLEYVAGVISHQVLPVCDYLKDVLTEKKTAAAAEGDGLSCAQHRLAWGMHIGLLCAGGGADFRPGG